MTLDFRTEGAFGRLVPIVRQQSPQPLNASSRIGIAAFYDASDRAGPGRRGARLTLRGYERADQCGHYPMLRDVSLPNDGWRYEEFTTSRGSTSKA